MEIDHIFICVQSGAPEAEVLKQFGLCEGSNNVHPGQGTANRRFFFQNAMLELLWLENEAEVQSELTRPTGLYERCSQNDPNVSPFGVCFRPDHETETAASFPSWIYKPHYLPKPLQIEIGIAPLPEPLWFFASFFSAPDPTEKREPTNHPVGLKTLTRVTTHFPKANHPSETTAIVREQPGIQCKHSKAHLLELEFDHGQKKLHHDFRPTLPLVFKW